MQTICLRLIFPFSNKDDWPEAISLGAASECDTAPVYTKMSAYSMGANNNVFRIV